MHCIYKNTDNTSSKIEAAHLFVEAPSVSCHKSSKNVRLETTTSSMNTSRSSYAGKCRFRTSLALPGNVSGKFTSNSTIRSPLFSGFLGNGRPCPATVLLMPGLTTSVIFMLHVLPSIVDTVTEQPHKDWKDRKMLVLAQNNSLSAVLKIGYFTWSNFSPNLKKLGFWRKHNSLITKVLVYYKNKTYFATLNVSTTISTYCTAKLDINC